MPEAAAFKNTWHRASVLSDPVVVLCRQVLVRQGHSRLMLQATKWASSNRARLPECNFASRCWRLAIRGLAAVCGRMQREKRCEGCAVCIVIVARSMQKSGLRVSRSQIRFVYLPVSCCTI